MGAVRDGDDRAFEALYARYGGRVSAFVGSRVRDHARAEDITQEVFFSALKRMRQTDGAITFKPWIYEIARNACIDQFRRSRRAEELSFDDEGSLAPGDHIRLVSPSPGPEAAVESKQRFEHLRGAFGGLSEQHHQILVLRELEGLSYREIGERMSLSRPAVESTLFRARRRLGEEYDDLVSGRRCERVQATIDADEQRSLGIRDRRRLKRHLSCCESCRRHAALAGAGRPGLAGRLAALLPVGLLRRSRDDAATGAQAATARTSGLQSMLAPLGSLGAAAEPAALSWGKAFATLATVAVAGLGAGVATDRGPLRASDLRGLPVVSLLTGSDQGAASGGDRDGRGAPADSAAGAPSSALPGRPGGRSPGLLGRDAAGTGVSAVLGVLPVARGEGVPGLPGLPDVPKSQVPGVGGGFAGDGSGPAAPGADPPAVPEAPGPPETQAPTAPSVASPAQPSAPAAPAGPSAPAVSEPQPAGPEANAPAMPSAPAEQAAPGLTQ